LCIDQEKNQCNTLKCLSNSNLHNAKSIFLNGDNSELLLVILLVLLLLRFAPESLLRSIDKEKLSKLSIPPNDCGELAIGRDMLLSILCKNFKYSMFTKFCVKFYLLEESIVFSVALSTACRRRPTIQIYAAVN
jgi:hypothetical protein